LKKKRTKTDIVLNSQRILIVKQSSLGDIIHTLALVHAFKRCYPEVSIGWVVQKAFASIVERDPAVDDVFVIDIPSTSEPTAKKNALTKAVTATLRTLKDLRRVFSSNPYDLVLDLHASFRSWNTRSLQSGRSSDRFLGGQGIKYSFSAPACRNS